MTADQDKSPGIFVRLATIDDAAALAGLSTQLGYPTSEDDARRRMAQISGNPENVVFVVALPDGRVVGWLHAYLCHLVESDLYAEIGGLVVDQQHRRSGAGRLLMQHAEHWARGKSCKTVSLRSNVIREGAHAFYHRLGYEVVKTQSAFRKVL
ncbi:MAG TPA: GNAT family N-acetyltransferase [Terriglobia bacterium]|nr:GNAT family N-acetyltransferase [Terriglobia bacterium]